MSPLGVVLKSFFFFANECWKTKQCNMKLDARVWTLQKSVNLSSGDRSVAPTPMPGVLVVASFVDNANMFVWDEQDVTSALTALETQLDGAGLMFREECLGECQMESLRTLVGWSLSRNPTQTSAGLASALRSAATGEATTMFGDDVNLFTGQWCCLSVLQTNCEAK